MSRSTTNGSDPAEVDTSTEEHRLATAITALPVTAGGDPVPAGANGSVSDIDIRPPPGIEDMPPLSATAMSSFASAAKGVTTKDDLGPGQNGNAQGLLVLNGSTT